MKACGVAYTDSMKTTRSEEVLQAIRQTRRKIYTLRIRNIKAVPLAT
jgi:hypothetical protein